MCGLSEAARDHEVVALRRFNEFDKLQRQLAVLLPGPACPVLPPKTWQPSAGLSASGGEGRARMPRAQVQRRDAAAV